MTPGGTGASDLAGRSQALLDAVAPLGARALVCYSSGRHVLTEGDPVWWLTRFRAMGETIATIAPDGGVQLWVQPQFDAPRAADGTGADVRTWDLAALHDWARSTAGEQQVGLWGRHKLTAGSARRLEAGLGCPIDVGDACEELARRRTTKDVAVLERASRLADEGHRAMLAAARPGRAEYEVAAVLQARMRELGAGDTFLLLSSSRHNVALHPPTERLLAEGDVLLVELSPSVDGMYTQLCRSAVLGEAAEALRDDYAVLLESLERGAAACAPGATCAEVVAVMDEVIAGAGYADFCRPPHMRARGHGLGLASAMPGDLTRDNGRVLATGDVFVLHPNQYLPGPGYLLCGEPLVVTEGGGRPLSGSFAGLGVVPT